MSSQPQAGWNFNRKSRFENKECHRMIRMLRFTKMNGAGNDFVLLDNRAGDLGADAGSKSPGLCDRHRGVGADGVLLLEPPDKRRGFSHALLQCRRRRSGDVRQWRALFCPLRESHRRAAEKQFRLKPRPA